MAVSQSHPSEVFPCTPPPHPSPKKARLCPLLQPSQPPGTHAESSAKITFQEKSSTTFTEKDSEKILYTAMDFKLVL